MIPKVIHYCWFGGGRRNALMERCISSWRRYLPDYEIKEWNESNYDCSRIPYMKEAYEAGKWAFVTDCARLDILNEYGGIYLDTDVEVLRPLDELLELPAVVGVDSTGLVNSGQILAAEKHNPIIAETLDYYRASHFINEEGSYNMAPSSDYQTAVLEERGWDKAAKGSIQTLTDITVFPEDYFGPLDFTTRELNITDNTYSVHWFTMTWLSGFRNATYRLNALELRERGRGRKITPVLVRLARKATAAVGIVSKIVRGRK